MKKIFSTLVLMTLALVLVACGGENEGPNGDTELDFDFKDKLELRVALQKISYEQSTPYKSKLNNKTYSKGDILPIMEKIGDILNVKWIDSKVGTSNAAIWQENIANNFASVDLTTGPADEMTKVGMEGKVVNIFDYIDHMPHYKKFLEENPAVMQSVTAYDGGSYFMPSFDGYKELRVMQLARIDWIEDILDAATTDLFDTAATEVGTNYTPINGESASYKVTVANADGTTRVVEKKRTANIITTLRAQGNTSGKNLANTFRTYIEETYGGLEKSGYAKWSDVFAGVDASYDMDELVALMYVIQANKNYILRETEGKVSEVHFWFPRQQKAGAHNRSYTTAIEMMGVRWNLFIDENNKIRDGRGGTPEQTQEYIDATNQFSALFKDGLITHENFVTNEVRQELITGNTGKFGFMIFDYNNSTANDALTSEGRKLDPTLKMEIILPPVNQWFEDEWFAFSSEVRNIQTGGTTIPKHVEKDIKKLSRLIYYLDQTYNFEDKDGFGTITVFGPEEWLTGETITYNNDKVWLLKDEANQEMIEIANGHMTNYVTKYLGYSAAGIYRTLGREYLSLGEEAKQGIEKLNTAVAAGSVRIPGVYEESDPKKASWYKLIPGFFPLTLIDITAIGQTTFRDTISDTQIRTLIENGFSGTAGSMSAAAYHALIANEFDSKYIQPYQRAYDKLLGK